METLKKIWAWLKMNWKWLLFPVGALLFIIGRLSLGKGSGVITVDPTAKADERAAAEAERRKVELAQQDAQLQARLQAVRTEHAQKLQQLSESQLQHAASLEGDPEALNEFLRSL